MKNLCTLVGLIFALGFIGASNAFGAASVSLIKFNDGSMHCSFQKSFQVTLTGATVGDLSNVVLSTEDETQTIPLTWTDITSNSGTVTATATPSGPLVDGTGSLETDRRYLLKFNSLIVYTFFRLLGDLNCNGTIANMHLNTVRNSLFDTSNMPRYRNFIDLDGNGTVLNADLNIIRNRLFAAVPPPVVTIPRGTADLTMGANGRRVSGLNAHLAVGMGSDTRTNEWVTAIKYVNGYCRMAKLKDDGTLVSPAASFGADGVTALINGVCKDFSKTSTGSYLTTAVSMNYQGYEYSTFYRMVTVDGAPDTAFGVGGNIEFTFLPNIANYAYGSAQILSTGQILTVYSYRASASEPYKKIIFQLRGSNGYLDTTFGTQGYVTLEPGYDSIKVSGARALSGGAFLVMGAVRETATSENRIFLAKFLVSGNTLVPDFTFGSNGFVLSPADLVGVGEPFMASFSNGKILLAFSSLTAQGEKANVLQLTANGELDPAFAASGVWQSVNPLVSGFTKVSLYPNSNASAPGSMIVGMNEQIGTQTNVTLVELDPAGVPNQSFGIGGYSRLPQSSDVNVAARLDSLYPGFNNRLIGSARYFNSNGIHFHLLRWFR